jgi:hypothetical protein
MLEDRETIDGQLLTIMGGSQPPLTLKVLFRANDHGARATRPRHPEKCKSRAP